MSTFLQILPRACCQAEGCAGEGKEGCDSDQGKVLEPMQEPPTLRGAQKKAEDVGGGKAYEAGDNNRMNVQTSQGESRVKVTRKCTGGRRGGRQRKLLLFSCLWSRNELSDKT